MSLNSQLEKNSYDFSFLLGGVAYSFDLLTLCNGQS